MDMPGHMERRSSVGMPVAAVAQHSAYQDASGHDVLVVLAFLDLVRRQCGRQC